MSMTSLLCVLAPPIAAPEWSRRRCASRRAALVIRRALSAISHASVGRKDQVFINRLTSLLLKLPANLLEFPHADRGVR